VRGACTEDLRVELNRRREGEGSRTANNLWLEFDRLCSREDALVSLERAWERYQNI
jgi:hypothetical protein